MRIRMLSTAAGAAGVYTAGQVVEVDAETAVAWLNGGYAEPVAGAVERATIEPGEMAVEGRTQKGGHKATPVQAAQRKR